MLSININNDWIPLSAIQNYFIDADEEGNQSLQFDIPLNETYYKIKLETQIKSDGNLWLVKQINQLTSYATIMCELDMDAWKASFYVAPATLPQLQTKSLGDALNYIKPTGWTILNASVCTIKRTLDLAKCTAYELLMRAKTVYDVQLDIDALSKTITVVNPYVAVDNGVYITPELNLTKTSYKGDSKQIATRLYCYGADDLTFANINGGKPYVEDVTYKGTPICAVWTDGRYTNMESLLADGRKRLKDMATPLGAYTLDVVDLSSIDPLYKDLEFNLRHVVHCIVDPDKGVDIVHRIVKKRNFPDEPHRNVITLSNLPRTIEKEWNTLKENVETVKKDGYRNETEIRQTNTEVTTIAKKTAENTKGIQSVEQQITPEQMLITVGNSINAGNKLNTMQVIIDLLGLTVKNGGIKIYDGNNNLVFYVDQNTKKLVMDGNIFAQSGNIAGWKIDENGLYSDFDWTVPNYTQSDLDKIRQHITGEITLSAAEIDYLDISQEGDISVQDYAIVKNIINGVYKKTWKYTIRINPKNVKGIIAITVDKGKGAEISTKINANGIQSATIDYINQRLTALEKKG